MEISCNELEETKNLFLVTRVCCNQNNLQRILCNKYFWCAFYNFERGCLKSYSALSFDLKFFFNGTTAFLNYGMVGRRGRKFSSYKLGFWHYFRGIPNSETFFPQKKHWFEKIYFILHSKFFVVLSSRSGVGGFSLPK